MGDVKKTRKNSDCLVINQGAIPIDVIPWEESITAWVTGRAIVLAEYDDLWISTGHNTNTGVSKFKVPSVIQYPHAPVDKVHYVKTLYPSKENLLKRDNYKCVYCGVRVTIDTATIDHVHPHSKGGLTDWINCRIACSTCNRRKGSKLLTELGWTISDVSVPSLSNGVSHHIISKVGGRILDESWRPFINWEVVWK